MSLPMHFTAETAEEANRERRLATPLRPYHICQVNWKWYGYVEGASKEAVGARSRARQRSQWMTSSAERVHVQNCSDSQAGFGFSFEIEFTLLGTLRENQWPLLWNCGTGTLRNLSSPDAFCRKSTHSVRWVACECISSSIWSVIDDDDGQDALRTGNGLPRILISCCRSPWSWGRRLGGRSVAVTGTMKGWQW